MSVKAIADQLIDQLLTSHADLAHQSLIALENSGLIPNGATGLKVFRSVVSWETWYGSTAGPFGGIGGAAMTLFRMTVLHSGDAMLLFASTQFSDQFYGAAPFNAGVLAERNVNAFTRPTVSRERSSAK
jgi:flavorubredoxin